MTPDPTNLMLGAGEVSFDRFDAAGASSGYMRSLGNVEAFSTSASIDTVQKKSSLSGSRALLAEVVVGSEISVALTLNEFDSKNLALALLGTDSLLNQTAAATVTDKVIDDTLFLDVYYDLGYVNATVTSVKQGATTLNAAAYSIDAKAGLIKFLSSYTGTNKATAGSATTWSGSAPAIADVDLIPVIQALTVGQINGHLCYVAASDQAQGPRYRVDIWKCSLLPDGDLPFIGTDFASFNLKGKVMQDATRTTGQQYITVRRLL